MATHKRVTSIAYAAGADYSSSQFRIVGIASDGQVDPLADGTTMPIGVLLNKPAAAGAGAEVAVAGSDVKLEAGAALNEGDLVVAVTGGRGSAVASGGTAYIIGVCTQAASGSGAIAGVLVMPSKVVAAP